MKRLALLLSLMGSTVAAFGWWPEAPDSMHVLAVPHLNVRSLSTGQIQFRLPYGEAIASNRLRSSGEWETISGLRGQWLLLDDTLKVFDAYLWCTDPPRREEEEVNGSWVLACETLSEYASRVVDGMHVLRSVETHENYGGPGGDKYGMDVRATSGQALQFFRRMLTDYFASVSPSRVWEPEQQGQLDRILKSAWDGSEPLSFSWGSEGGGFTFLIRPSELGEGAYYIAYSMGTC